MEPQNQLCYDKNQLQLYFIELLYKEELISRATYYKAKEFIYSGDEKE